MKVLIGTSGWVYKDWEGKFYPEDLPAKDKLSFFAKEFKTVEINNTFYRLPSEDAVKKWYSGTPDDFIFTAKLSRYLTHLVRLNPGSKFDDGMKNYFSRIRHLKSKLAVVLVQLPASFSAKPGRIENLARKFEESCAQNGLNADLACEFRDISWFKPEVFKTLESLNIASVIASGPGKWPESRSLSADFAFIRFHGDKRLYGSSYSDKALDKWAEFTKRNCAGCKKVFCYFNNDQSAKAVANARYLKSKF